MNIVKAASFLLILLFLAFACTPREIAKHPKLSFEVPLLSKDIDDRATKGFPLNLTTTFTTDDHKVIASLKLKNLSEKHTLRYDWYDPNGNLYSSTGNRTIEASKGKYIREMTTWHSLSIRGERAADYPGEWKVHIYVDKALVGSKTFIIVSSFEMMADRAIDEICLGLTKSLTPNKRFKVAVADPLGPNDIHTQLGSFINEKLIKKLFESGRFEKVLERKLLQNLLAQQSIEMEGYFDPETVRSLCEKIGTDAVVMGSIMDCGSRVDVNMRLIDMKGEILSVSDAQIEKGQAINSMMEDVKKATLTIALNPSDVDASIAVADRKLKNIDGITIFKDIPQGKQGITITAKGYETVQRYLYLTHDQSIKISLEKHTSLH